MLGSAGDESACFLWNRKDCGLLCMRTRRRRGSCSEAFSPFGRRARRRRAGRGDGRVGCLRHLHGSVSGPARLQELRQRHRRRHVHRRVRYCAWPPQRRWRSPTTRAACSWPRHGRRRGSLRPRPEHRRARQLSSRRTTRAAARSESGAGDRRLPRRSRPGRRERRRRRSAPTPTSPPTGSNAVVTLTKDNQGGKWTELDNDRHESIFCLSDRRNSTAGRAIARQGAVRRDVGDRVRQLRVRRRAGHDRRVPPRHEGRAQAARRATAARTAASCTAARPAAQPARSVRHRRGHDGLA